MAKFQKCEGEDCPLKDTCVRFTSLDDFLNWVYEYPPYYFSNGEYLCEYYVDGEEKTLDQFKDLLNEN